MAEIERRLGKRLRELRRLRHLTQAQLAEKTGLSDNFIGAIERGIRSPKLKTLAKIAGVLGVEVDDLFKLKPALQGDRKKIIKRITHYLEDRDERELRLILELIELILSWKQ